MRRILALLLLAVACSDEAGQPSRSTTTTAPPVVIVANEVCGPTDGLAIAVEVTGANARGLVAELVVDGEVVADSDADATGADSLLLDSGFGTDEVDGGVVRVRPVTGGPPVAVDRTIGPLRDSCG